MSPAKLIRKGDLVRFGEHQYVVSRANRLGLLRLLGAEAEAPRVAQLVAPTKVKLISRPTQPHRRSHTPRERLEAIALLLREVRTQLGWTTRTMADNLGFSQAMVTRSESSVDRSPPSPTYLKRFAEVTGADEDLLCATAGVVPDEVADALMNVETLRAVRALIERERHEPAAAAR